MSQLARDLEQILDHHEEPNGQSDRKDLPPIINYRMIASAVWTTQRAVDATAGAAADA